MRISLLFTGWLALLLVLSLAACGTQNMGSLTQLDGSHQVTGVQLGGYEVVRYNANGTADPTLNGTLDLRLEGNALVIGVNDSVLTTNVLLDVKYDAGSVHPVKAEFHGLLGNSSQVLSAAFIDQVAGLAGIGETAIGDYNPGPLHGDVVTVQFESGAMRTASAANDVYVQATGVGYTIEPTAYAPGLANLSAVAPVVGEAQVTWFCTWARADGNQDSLVNIGDLTPLGANFGQTIDVANFARVPADYNNDSLVNIGDLTPLGAHFNERYDGYVVEAADNVDGATKTAVSTVSYASGTAKAGAAAHPNLKTICRWWEVDFTATSAFTMAQLGAIDAAGNQDGAVRIYVTPQETTVPPSTLGTPAFVEVQAVTPGIPVNITGFDIQAVGATGGSIAADIFADGDTGTYVANATGTMQLNSITGTWDGAAFNATTFPGTMVAADYDAIKTAVAGALGWTFVNEGDTADPAARFTGPWFAPDNTGYTGVGDPGAGKVCPDDDPESTTTPEGGLDVSLGTGVITQGDNDFTINVTTAVDLTFAFDLTADPLAPVNEGYYIDHTHSAKLAELATGPGSSTIVYMNMTSWGATAAVIPADPSNWVIELKQVTGQDASAPTISFAYDTGGTHAPALGKFIIETLPVVLVDVCVINVDGTSLQLGQNYAARFFDGTTWSSINNPSDLLVTAPPPPEEDLLTIPRVYGRGQTPPPYLQIFRNEPIVRRDSRITIDLFNNTANPTMLEAYQDILKTNGTEFTVNLEPRDVGGHPVYFPYPVIAIIEGSDASVITDENYAGKIPDCLIPQTGGRERGRLCVDVQALILNLPAPVPGVTKYFCYKVFKSDGTAEGTGKFEVPAEPVEPSLPIGIATGGNGFGVNVGDRGAWDKDTFNTTATATAINGSTMNTPTPDVLWVYFNGTTRVLDWDEYWGAGAPANNLAIVFEDTSDLATYSVKMALTIVGVTPTGNYIAVHDVSRNDGAGYYYDWVDPAVPAGGILYPGGIYNVYLDDPTTAGLDYEYPTTMNVIGNNPNVP
jgi:hypothetical protein